MKKYTLFLITNLVFCHYAFGESFLSAQKFPKTFQDLSFVERMQVEAEGYAPYESEYDANGVCIKNCAYHGITIKREEERSVLNTQNAMQKSLQYEQKIQNEKFKEKSLPVDTQKIIAANNANCANRNYAVQPGTSVPRAEPVMNTPRISSPFGQRIHPTTGNKSFHQGIDYAVPIGTMVYTPAEGKVVSVINDGNCGKGVKLKHPDGTYTLCCHLSDTLVNVGDNVSAGCAVALSGNTGRSTGPHLHYSMLDSNNNYIDPSKYTGRAN